jgi:hypothetical protein
MTAFNGRGYKVSGKVRQKKYQDRATLGYRKQPALVIGRAFQRRYSAKEIRKLGYQFLN